MNNSLSEETMILAAQGAAQPTVSEAPTSNCPQRRVSDSDMTLFMLSTTKCTACRTLQEVAGKPSSQRLHVRCSGDLLLITEADDLHSVGLPLVAQRVIEFPRAKVFRLLAEPPMGRECNRLRPAAGIVTLGRQDGYWTLKAVGKVHGATTPHAQIYSATEIKD